MKQRAFSGSPYESKAGFCRALRCGDDIQVAGTAPLGADGKTVSPGDVGPQTRRCLEIIREALQSLGADLADVVRTRIFVTRADDFPEVARVHGEFFQTCPPACTCVVTGLLDPDWRVEVEAYARLSNRVRAWLPEDRIWVQDQSERLFGGRFVVSRGQAHRVSELEGFVMVHGEHRLGLASYLIAGECELVTLNAFEPRSGAGTLLLEAVERAAREAKCRSVWLITTNDNLDALRFYQRRGYHLVALHNNAIDQVSRPLKPQIPTIGHFGIPIRDELELYKPLLS